MGALEISKHAKNAHVWGTSLHRGFALSLQGLQENQCKPYKITSGGSPNPTAKPRGLPAIKGDLTPPSLSLPVTPLTLISRLLSLLQLLQGGG